MRQITMSAAIREAMSQEMRKDKTVFLAGEDIGIMGGAQGVTQGMFEEFGPDRIVDTPISETAIAGLAVGSAAVGYRPIIELMMGDFLTICMDEIANQAAKMRYMFGGKAKIPMVVRVAGGAGVSGAAQHSQSLEALVAHIPGLKVVLPSNAYDAKGLLISSIRDDNPVIFLEGKAIYSAKGDCPEEEYSIPLGEAKLISKGSDATIVSWSQMVPRSVQAAAELAKHGISVDVIDIRTLVPLDTKTIIDSVKKTGKLVIVQEAYRTCGFAAEISAIVAEEAFSYLKKPIIRVTAPNTTIPFS
ncbi:MAG: alpha-ketoacid dehydrogenase subunit beta, partial [Actinobacteria bacterium]|nr:alpha-ketoacid dehydrogenase subunit beta [Actinomycetota bacterium]